MPSVTKYQRICLEATQADTPTPGENHLPACSCKICGDKDRAIERFGDAHPPELVGLLWEHFNATKGLLPDNGVVRRRIFGIRKAIEDHMRRPA